MYFDPKKVLMCDSIGGHEYLIYRIGPEYTLFELYHTGEDRIMSSYDLTDCFAYFWELTGRKNQCNAAI